MAKVLTIVFLLLAFVVCSARESRAQTTEFTFQGSLKDSAVPANGNYDFEFALFDMLSAGSQIGATIPKNNVPVANGIFSVKLDFGAVFPGADRFLEVRVRLAGQPGITTLSPRQLVNSAPYSVKSLNTDNAATAANALQLGGIAANQFVVTTDPRMTDARPPTVGSADYIQNQNAAQQVSSNFSISGNGTAGGTLSGNIVNATTQYNIGGNRVLSINGADNLFTGVNAGAANISGTSNLFVGISAGASNSTGSNNSFIGSFAGNNNTTGTENSFLGRGAGFKNTGVSNSFFGFHAGFENTSGGNNTFVGMFAGTSNVTGGNNTLVGSGANFGSNNLTNATAIGWQALVAQSNSVVLGNNANVGIGTPAPSEKLHVVGNGLITGNLTVNGTLSGNIVNAATQFNLGGSRILSNAGTNNLFAGVNAGLANTGSFNAFFGQGAGQANTTGGSNAFFGRYAGQSNTTGFANAFFGEFAGAANTTGSYNAFFGQGAGQANMTGEENVYFGVNAGLNSTTGNSNTFIGTQSGFSNINGSNNTALGYQSDVSSGITNATAIGRRALVTQNNSLVLGSINGVNGATADTNVGIGTTAPNYKLHVVGQDARVEGNNAGIFPRFSLNFTGGAADEKRWQNYASANSLSFSALNDAETAETGWLTVNRGPGTTISGVSFPNGNVAIGIASTPDKLGVNGTVSIGTLGNAGGTALCRNASNQISTCSSSLRYKTNISGFSSGLAFVNQLRPISFDWKDGGMKDVGFGAEDIAKIDPRFVTYNSAGEVEGVKYDRLSVAFVNAFKEQQAQIEAQQKQNQSQQAQIEQQRKQIESLTKIVCAIDAKADTCRQ